MVLRKDELEVKLAEDALLIKSGVLKDENPLDSTAEFHDFLMACRHGDLRRCQELISRGVNINGKDEFDYTPLIIMSLTTPSGDEMHTYKMIPLSSQCILTNIPGALAERNTFQGERCIYNALNDRIRNLLLQYDFSKSSDPYVYWSTHISTLLGRTNPRTADISLVAGARSFELHKFLLSSRSPYFRQKLAAAPDTATWKLAASIPVEAFQIVLRYMYLGEVPRDLAPPGSGVSEEEVVRGLDKISKQLEVEQLWEAIMAGSDRRLARQRYQDEVERAQKQVEAFFQQHVAGHKMGVDADRVQDVKWKHDNAIFADVLLRADEPPIQNADGASTPTPSPPQDTPSIPIGPAAAGSEPAKTRRSVLYPAHKAMLIRSEYFERMFSGDFVESQRSEHLRVVTVDCTPAVLEIILRFLYTETVVCPLEHALDLLYAADMLFLDALKNKAAVAISTLGSGTANVLVDRTHHNTTTTTTEENGAGDQEEDVEMEPINIYDVVHAAWDLRVQRLEEFAARYLAYRLEDYIDEPEFHDLIAESAHRIQARQETDTIELLDDIRSYLSERFRLRFEDAGLDDMMDEDGDPGDESAEAALADHPVQIPDAHAVTKPHGIKDAAPVIAEKKKTTLDAEEEVNGGAMRTIDGDVVEDEFVSDAINYQLLLRKIDAMLERLNLDA